MTDLRTGRTVYGPTDVDATADVPYTLEIPLSGLRSDSEPVRNYEVTICGSDQSTVFASAFGVLEFPHESPAAIRDVRVRRDGTLLVNGAPWLMMGIWDSYFRKPYQYERLSEMASAGFNFGPGNTTVWHPSMYFLAGPRTAGNMHDAREPVLPANWANHPNMLGWFWWDEPFYMLRAGERKRHPGSHFHRLQGDLAQVAVLRAHRVGRVP